MNIEKIQDIAIFVSFFKQLHFFFLDKVLCLEQKWLLLYCKFNIIGETCNTN